ncbi:hypothetical protein [Rhodoplanes roseus]|uniref:Uncharacterized protein n=1 Tax=Rhodoplanes roseus TaxID=29409 RepID=A0A327KLZ3_9BRAD|nr:hypothetical protein [Rhodoplanes roseus]RAI39880.1 hypothetical protein CH341_24970 [Rhodoplanes roseus]
MPEFYRGSKKHKNRPATGRKGTLCPEWTHITDVGLGNDVDTHPWEETQAGRLFENSLPCPDGSGRRFATARGIAFVAVPTNDGTWHGYPVPWQSVPAALKNRWQDEKLIRSRDLKRYMERPTDEVHWALESDDD